MSDVKPELGKWRSPQFLSPIVAVIFLYWCVTLLVVATDPIDMFDWGTPPDLLADYNRSHADYLYGAASRADVDLLLIGGSTLAAVRSADLVHAFRDTETAFNFSVTGPRPVDRIAIMKLVSRHSPAKRILLGFDWIFALPENIERSGVPTYILDTSLSNLMRIGSPTLFRLSLAKLMNKPLALDGWDYDYRIKQDTSRYERFQSTSSLKRLQEKIGSTIPQVEMVLTPNCGRFPMVTQHLVEFAESLQRKGVELDIIIPPYSLAIYRTWSFRRDIVARMAEPFLETQLDLRRCLVNAVANMPMVRVFAFDNEYWITGDIGNYRDTAHLFNRDILEYILESVPLRRHQLTSENVDKYSQDLIGNVTSNRILADGS